MSKVKHRLQNKVEDIFGPVTDFEIRGATLYFTAGDNATTFVKLSALSDLVKTEKIDFTGRTTEVRYSSYTSDTDATADIVCYDIFIL